jgi:hypothetical protein
LRRFVALRLTRVCVRAQICGVVVNVKRLQAQDKISVWTRDANDKKAVLAIGARLKHELELPDNAVLTYSKHLSEKAAPSASGSAAPGEKNATMHVL